MGFVTGFCLNFKADCYKTPFSVFHSAVRLVKIVILQTALAAKRMCRCLSALKIHTERRCGSFAAHGTIRVTAYIFCPAAAFQTTPRIVCRKVIQLFTAYLTGIPCFKCKAFVYQPPESCATFIAIRLKIQTKSSHKTHKS